MKPSSFRAPWWKWLALCVVAIAAVWRFGLATEHLVLGWLYFPLRVLPRVTVDVPSLVVGGLCLLGFVVGVHFTARWILRELAPGVAAGQRWSWQATGTLAAIVLLAFVAGTAMVGATHQVVWLIVGRGQSSATETEPLLGILETAREASRISNEKDDLTFLWFGFANYHDTYLALPPGGTRSANGELLHGWASYIIPFISSAPDIDLGVPWNRPPNARYFQCNLSYFVNPSIPGPYFDSDGFGYAHLAGNSHVLPLRQIEVEPGQQRLNQYQLREAGQLLQFADIRDGTANTILFGTVSQQFKPWGHPANIRDPSSGVGRSPDGFGGPPAWGGAQFGMCDGSVRFMSNQTDPRVLAQLATPAGGEASQVQPAPNGQ
jgi:hypothetical protein